MVLNHLYTADSNVYSEKQRFCRRSFEWYRKVLSSKGKIHYYSIYPAHGGNVPAFSPFSAGDRKVLTFYGQVYSSTFLKNAQRIRAWGNIV
ncbi:hypothetical protein D0A23_13685 [Bacillus amyloliquefaciens]|nr:hypothetical protein D0A23_13685 [Bacillus amyloliquefaciens]